VLCGKRAPAFFSPAPLGWRRTTRSPRCSSANQESPSPHTQGYAQPTCRIALSHGRHMPHQHAVPACTGAHAHAERTQPRRRGAGSEYAGTPEAGRVSALRAINPTVHRRARVGQSRRVSRQEAMLRESNAQPAMPERGREVRKKCRDAANIHRVHKTLRLKSSGLTRRPTSTGANPPHAKSRSLSMIRIFGRFCEEDSDEIQQRRTVRSGDGGIR
jgi:hypothetical protein